MSNQANAICVRCGLFRPRCRWIALKTKEACGLEKDGYACEACRKAMRGRFFLSCEILETKHCGREASKNLKLAVDSVNASNQP